MSYSHFLAVVTAGWSEDGLVWWLYKRGRREGEDSPALPPHPTPPTITTSPHYGTYAVLSSQFFAFLFPIFILFLLSQDLNFRNVMIGKVVC